MNDESEIIAAYGRQNADRIAAALKDGKGALERPARKPAVAPYQPPQEAADREGAEAGDLEMTPPPDTPETKRLQKREHEEQVRLFNEIKRAVAEGRRGAALIFAIPNGTPIARRPGRERAARRIGAEMRDEGVRVGVPDIFVAYPFGGKPGLFIEMKRPDGCPSDVSKAQREWLAGLDAAGYDTEVCYGFRHALRVIGDYLGWDDLSETETLFETTTTPQGTRGVMTGPRHPEEGRE